MWISREGCDLNTPGGLQQVIDHVRAMPVKPHAIGVDTLHRFLRGDENSAIDAKSMIDACAVLTREFNCAVILVHHTGVSEEAQHRARGSSAWRGALDIEISVVPNAAGLELVQRKSKDAELVKPLAARLESVAIDGWIDEDGEPVRSAVLVVTGQSEAPVKGKKESRIAVHQKLFTQAWRAHGERRDGAPYLSREGFRKHLETIGFKPGSIRNTIAPGSVGKPIHDLILAGFILPDGDGWTVVEPGWVAQLMLSSMSSDVIR